MFYNHNESVADRFFNLITKIPAPAAIGALGLFVVFGGFFAK